MAALNKALCVLPLLFIICQGQFVFPDPLNVGKSYGLGKEGAGVLGEGLNGKTFPNPFFEGENNGDDRGGEVTKEEGLRNPFFEPKNGFFWSRNGDVEGGNERNFETDYKGMWELVSKNSGVSTMHVILLPNNKVIMFDASAFHISEIKLPNGECLPFTDDKGITRLDCWSHGVEYDADSAKIRPLKMISDPWCSSGGLSVDGNLVSTGGWLNGTKSIRYFKPCDTCDWKEYLNALARPRWYATQTMLQDGSFIVVGGRRAYSFEFVPREGQTNTRAIRFPFLDETTDLDENNLYPFVHLSTDGNLFIFANNRSVLLNPKTHKIIHEFPVLEGGSRNYPASGMSALLPIKLQEKNHDIIPAEVIICGGAKPEAYRLAEKGDFQPALQDCARLDITNPNDVWSIETMPSRRVMGDMIILPTGDLLIVNGATQGTSAWFFAEGPNLVPVLYSPDKPENQRFKELEATKIPRMYHSSAALLPDGNVLIGGSNTNPGYNFTSKYPTEMRIEKFSPPYLDPSLAKYRPAIVAASTATKLTYGKEFTVEFTLDAEQLDKINDIKVTLYPPPFTTHGYSMGQRLIVLAKTEVVVTDEGTYRAPVVAPPSGAVAPPGYYLLFVVYRGVPSVGTWVHIQ